jgi:hypothetical protein
LSVNSDLSSTADRPATWWPTASTDTSGSHSLGSVAWKSSGRSSARDRPRIQAHRIHGGRFLDAHKYGQATPIPRDGCRQYHWTSQPGTSFSNCCAPACVTLLGTDNPRNAPRSAPNGLPPVRRRSGLLQDVRMHRNVDAGGDRCVLFHISKSQPNGLHWALLAIRRLPAFLECPGFTTVILETVHCPRGGGYFARFIMMTDPTSLLVVVPHTSHPASPNC